MTPRQIASARLRNTRLVGEPLATPVDVVRALGAVQSQDYPGATWAIGMRAPSVTAAEVDRAFDEGAIVRTHVLRPTWHFVAPEDLRWMLALTGPRVRQRMAPYDRHLELDDALLERSRKIIERALAGGRFLTRTELATALARRGIEVVTQRLAHVVMYAELAGVICSGPRRGKSITYALVDERVPAVPALDRDEALATLARRYVTSHGPATIADFVWWSGLTTADARRGIEAADADLAARVVDGATYWTARDFEVGRSSTVVHLLPNYDEYFIGHRDRSAIGHDAQEHDLRRFFGGTGPPNVLAVSGQIAGGWRRKPSARGLRLETKELRPLNGREGAALERAVAHFARFIGEPVGLDRRAE